MKANAEEKQERKKINRMKTGMEIKAKPPHLITQACYIPASSPPLMTATARLGRKQNNKKKKHSVNEFKCAAGKI